MMENSQRNRNVKKLKSVNATAVAVATSNPSRKTSSSFAYKNFNSARNKRRKNRKKYFEHDTRTHPKHSNVSGGGGATAPIKKIKFNNEINIYETRNDIATELDVSKCKPTMKKGQKKRGRGGFHLRCNAGGDAGGSGSGGGVVNIQSTTKRLQKQLIETQKKLQKQLNAMQQQQREQNNSFLALIHSNYLQANAKNDSEMAAATSLSKSTVIDDSHAIKNASCPNATHTSAHYSEQFLCQTDFCTDQSKCSIDKMANGNKATAIRAFNCDLKKVKLKSFTPPPPPTSSSIAASDIVCNHQCGTCIGYRKLASTVNVNAAAAAALSSPISPTANANHKKLLKIQLKKPLLKSIVLSTTKSLDAPAISSGIAIGKIKQETSDEQSLSTFAGDSIVTTNFMHTTEPTTPHYIDTMQFSNSKKTNKPINSFHSNNSNDFVRQQKSSRSYSPPLPATHRLASMVSSETHHAAPGRDRRSNSSRHQRDRSSKKRKKHRRTHSRGSRSRSYSRSRSFTRSHSRSTSRTRSMSRSCSHSRSRSYRRQSSHSHSHSRSRTRSRTHSRSRSSRSYSRSHHNDDRKSRRSSKSSTKRDGGDQKGSSGRGSAASKRHSNSKNKSKSPSIDSAISSSKRSNHSPSDSKRMKRSLANDGNGSTSKKKSTSSISSSGGQTVKPQPVVKLHSSPMTGSDTEYEIDDKFDRKYEELLTFETNEDERREQRLLKALSDIAAKAKQKIQSITDPNVPAAQNPNADRNHNDRSTPKSTTNTTENVPAKQSTNKSSEIALHDSDRQRTANRPPASMPSRMLQHQQPPSSFTRDRKPSKRDSSTKRSRRDSSCSSSSSSKEEKRTRSSKSPSIPRRRGSPSFLDRRRITSARKKPIPYQRSSPYDSYDEGDSP